MVAALFTTQIVFAHGAMKGKNKDCDAVAQACLNAGFGKHEVTDKDQADKNDGQKFWKDCMKPVLLGQSVKNVKVDADTAKACRTYKIEKMKKELNEFEQVSK